MTIDYFIKKIQNIEGLTEILDTCDGGQILTITSEIFEKPAGELSGLEIEALGVHGRRVSYGYATDILGRQSRYLKRLYETLRDDISRDTLYCMLKYWLLPDPSFLQEAIDLCPEIKDELTTIKTLVSFDSLSDNTEAVKHLQPGEEIVITIGNALEEIWLISGLLPMIRDDLSLRLCMKDIHDIHLAAGIPHTRMSVLMTKDRPLHVASIAKDAGEWHNAELLKDKGLVPYLLHERYGYDAVMVGVDNGGYTYLDEYLKGMRMEFLPDGSKAAKGEWIRSHAKDIDILIVNGVYSVNQEISRIYKELNPAGLTYMPLDANSIWMESMDHRNKDFGDMLDRMDVIATSGRKMQVYLNKKWPWPIEYFPNGYFAPWADVKSIDYDAKENTILTVSRVGSSEKANDIMMLAFERIADRIPGWTLRLVGGVDPGFEEFRRGFFDSYPKMKDRIIFTGAITDKAALYEEYRRAKIFTLTSRTEGAPNVVGEALHGGCAIAITEIDACQDATDCGRCGMTAPIDDIDAIADMYLAMCSDESRLREMCLDASCYAESVFSMRRVVERIHESLSEVL